MRPKACFCALPANCGSTPPQVPADAEASELVDSSLAEPAPAVMALGSAPHFSRDVGSGSEVPGFAHWRRAATPCALCHTHYFVRTCLVQVPAAASSSPRDLPPPPHATRSEDQLPSHAWPDTIAVDSNQHDDSEAPIASESSLAWARSRHGALTTLAAAAEL